VSADLFGATTAAPTTKLTKNQQKMMEAYERRPELLSVPCPRDFCRAKTGDPCRSSGGNLTFPHIPRADRAEEASARASETDPMKSTTEVRSTAPLSVDEARTLTDRIRSAAETLWSLLLEAYERQAWRTLGYGSWKDYVEEEFSMSRQHAYRLLDQGRVIRALEEATGGVSPVGDVSERDARAIKPDLPEVTEEIRERVEAGEEPTEAIRAVVEQKREERKAAATESDLEPEEEHPEYGAAPEVDPAAELAHALEENQRLEAALAATDQGAELRRWIDKYARLEGRVQQLLQTEGELKKQNRRQTTLLKDIRAALGVERDSEILPALRKGGRP
jgi:ribosomal protein S16